MNSRNHALQRLVLGLAGMLAIGAVAPVLAHRKGGARPGQWAEMHRHFARLNLSETQKSQFRALRSDLKAHRTAVRSSQDSAEVKKSRGKELREDFKSRAMLILTPEQRTRVAVQRKARQEARASGQQGRRHYARKGVRHNRFVALNLTQDQQQKLQEARKAFRNERQTLAAQQLSQEEKRAQMQQACERFRAIVQSTLTPEQRQQLEQRRGARARS